MQDRAEWLNLELTQKLVNQVKLELTKLAVNTSKGFYVKPDNADATQFYSGVAVGNVGAYQRILEYISGAALFEEKEPEQEVVKEYEGS